MIHVVNFRDRDNIPEPCFYVGRAMPSLALTGSPLSNPYRLTRKNTRDEVIGQYRDWLWAEMKKPESEAREALYHLAESAREGDIYLACWCAPENCHAHVIKAAIEWINTKETSDAANHQTIRN